MLGFHTLFKSKNEWQKIEQAPIPRASRNSPMSKQETKKIYNWTSEIIPLICFWKKISQKFHIYLKEAQESPRKNNLSLDMIKTTNDQKKTKSILSS